MSQVVDPPARAGEVEPAVAVAGREAGPPTEVPEENRRALIQLVVAVVTLVVLSIVLHFGAVLIVILALVLMIMLHELGHFATAKWSGMKVTEYFLGFGPRLWSVRKG